MGPSELQRQARQAYERARLRAALPWGTIGLVLAALTYGLVGGGWTLGLGAGLSVVLVALRWRGQDWGRGVIPGVVAGSIAWAVPLAWACSDGACSAQCDVLCTVMAAGSGALGGFVLWNRVGATSAVAALVVAALMASMGCLALGTSGLVGVFAVLVAGAPNLARQPVAV